MAVEMNTGNAQKLSQAMYESLSKMGGEDSTKIKEVVGKAMEVLAGANVKVVRGDDASVTGVGERKTTGATNVPALDNPADSKQVEANLMKLVAFLQLDNEERQTKMAKDRIELQKSNLDVEHKERMKDIDESIKKMKDAEKAAKVSRIFGWIGAVLAVAAAIALTIVTGGVAAGFAIAGAAIAVTSLVLNETGAMDKIVEKVVDKLMESNPDMSRSEAQMKASLIVNLTIMGLSLACSVGGMVAGIAAAGSAAANATKTGIDIAKTVQNAISITNTGVAVGALAAGGANTYFTHRSENAKADVTELEKFITMLQQRLDESQEELQILLQQIESGIGKIAELIASSTDTSDEIARNLGQMA